MEKEQTISIPVELYEELQNIKSEKEYEEDEKYREQTEKEYESAKNSLKKKMFDLCVENSDACEVVNSILDRNTDLVADVFETSSPFEIEGDIMDFVEGQDYHDPIIGETFTLSDWTQFFHNPEEWNTVEILHERCKELYKQKQELLDKLQALLKESC